MRLIDADNVKKRIEKSVSNYFGEYSVDMLNMWGLFTKIIDETPTVEERPTGEWIPVSERLPDAKTYVLTTTIYQEVYCDYWNGVEFDRTEYVIAWMLLPEPYKKGGAE